MKNVHINETLHQCQDCDKSFKHAPSLSNHMVIAHSEPEFVCEICDMKSHFNHELNKHILDRHSDNPEETFHCGKCEKIYKYKCTLKKHMLSEHPENV